MLPTAQQAFLEKIDEFYTAFANALLQALEADNDPATTHLDALTAKANLSTAHAKLAEIIGYDPALVVAVPRFQVGGNYTYLQSLSPATHTVRLRTAPPVAGAQTILE